MARIRRHLTMGLLLTLPALGALTGCGRDNDVTLANQMTYDPHTTGAKVEPGRTTEPSQPASPENPKGVSSANQNMDRH